MIENEEVEIERMLVDTNEKRNQKNLKRWSRNMKKKHEGEGQQFIVTKENQRQRCKKGNHWNQLITRKVKIEANFL